MAGVAPMGVYNHFRSKACIAGALFVRGPGPPPPPDSFLTRAAATIHHPGIGRG